jgi:hypothetical protein
MKRRQPRRWKVALKRGGGTLLVLFVAGAVALWIAGCGAVITPPMHVEAPATIYVMDYGRHTTLLLPAVDEASADALSGEGLGSGGASECWIEYAYGEWRWFALDETDWIRVFPVMLWPTRGALGRVSWEMGPGEIQRERWIPEDGLISLDVEAAQVAKLLARLDERYESIVETHLYGERHRLHFVQDEASYHLFHNCNHETARWLRELGCEVEGLAILADFRLSERAREHAAP